MTVIVFKVHVSQDSPTPQQRTLVTPVPVAPVENHLTMIPARRLAALEYVPLESSTSTLIIHVFSVTAESMDNQPINVA